MNIDMPTLSHPTTLVTLTRPSLLHYTRYHHLYYTTVLRATFTNRAALLNIVFGWWLDRISMQKYGGGIEFPVTSIPALLFARMQIRNYEY